MGGASGLQTLATGQNETLVVNGNTYSVSANVFNNQALLTINGNQYTVSAGSTQQLPDGTYVGVTQIISGGTQTQNNLVTFILGGRQLVLQDGQQIKVNGNQLSGSTVSIPVTLSSGNTLQTSTITVSYQPNHMFTSVGGQEQDHLGLIRFSVNSALLCKE